MSLPAGFGIGTGRAQSQGASGSKQINKVSVSQPVLRKSPPKKKNLDKRKSQDDSPQLNKKLKGTETASEFPYEAPVTAAGDWFAKMADVYLGPGRFHNWQQRTGDQAAEACRCAAGELFFHLTCNPSDTEKLRARLDAAEEENKKMKKKLEASEKDKSSLEKFKTSAERDIIKLKADADNLRIELNKTAQELTDASGNVLVLENKVKEMQEQMTVVESSSFASGFRSYVTGFLAVDPDYDWSKFVPATRAWIEEFKVEEAKAIEDKRMEIELEAASASATQFLQQESPYEARQDGEETREDAIPRLQNGENTQDAQTTDVLESQPKPGDSSQDQT